MRLVKVIILYKTDAMFPGDNPSKLTNVSVFDGPRLVGERSGWASGDFSTGMWPENVLEIPSRPEVQFGIQIFLSFESADTSRASHITCYGFGADFDDVGPPSPILA